HTSVFQPALLLRSSCLPMRRPQYSTLFPYTTLFRSWAVAAGHLRTALQLNPKSLVLHYNLAICAIWLDLKDEAIHEFEWVMAHRSEEHTSELQSRGHLVCRLLLEKKTSCLLRIAVAR